VFICLFLCAAASVSWILPSAERFDLGEACSPPPCSGNCHYDAGSMGCDDISCDGTCVLTEVEIFPLGTVVVCECECAAGAGIHDLSHGYVIPTDRGEPWFLCYPNCPRSHR
jgi:hypothetical protein